MMYCEGYSESSDPEGRSEERDLCDEIFHIFKHKRRTLFKRHSLRIKFVEPVYRVQLCNLI